MNDEMIVDLYFARDESALSLSADKYGKKLGRISFNITRSTQVAEECENDTYLAAWNSIPPKSPKTYLFAYLAKIIRNISINAYNKNRADKRYAHVVELTKEMEQCIPHPSDELCKLSDGELCESISKFLRSLDGYERDVFVLRYWYCESVKEIAGRFSEGESKIKSQLMRTRNKMKKYFESEGLEL